MNHDFKNCFLSEKGLLFHTYTRDEHRIMNLMCFYHDEDLNVLTIEERGEIFLEILKLITKGVKMSFTDYKMFMKGLKKMRMLSQVLLIECIYNRSPKEFDVDDTIEYCNNVSKLYEVQKLNQMEWFETSDGEKWK